MTPALLNRTSSRVSRARKDCAEVLIDSRSARSRGRKCRVPVEDGWEFWIHDIAACARSALRAAM